VSVRLRHPELEGQEIDVAESAVPFHRAAGWQVIEGQDEQGEEWPAELQPFEGQPPIRMRHPDVADEITVAESAVPIHRSSGWQVVEDEADEESDESADDGLDELTVAQLQDEIRTLNKLRPDDAQLPVSGTKAELLERLRNAPPDEPPDEADEAKPEAAADKDEEA
jgi:hypothetical protein